VTPKGASGWGVQLLNALACPQLEIKSAASHFWSKTCVNNLFVKPSFKSQSTMIQLAK
jgi:hypothetical protein